MNDEENNIDPETGKVLSQFVEKANVYISPLHHARRIEFLRAFIGLCKVSVDVTNNTAITKDARNGFLKAITEPIVSIGGLSLNYKVDTTLLD